MVIYIYILVIYFPISGGWKPSPVPGARPSLAADSRPALQVGVGRQPAGPSSAVGPPAFQHRAMGLLAGQLSHLFINYYV